MLDGLSEQPAWYSPDICDLRQGSISELVLEFVNTLLERLQPTAIEQAAEDCLAASVQNYRSPDWGRYNEKASHAKPVKHSQPLFDTLGIAVEQALDPDEAVYGTWQDRELIRDYLIGWLTHCLMERKIVSRQDPRIPYQWHMESHAPSDLQTRKRITRQFEEFGYGYRSYPLPPFWDHDMAGPPSPAP